jgi:hypothetical protein
VEASSCRSSERQPGLRLRAGRIPLLKRYAGQALTVQKVGGDEKGVE